MKRDRSSRKANRTGNIRQDLSVAQLAAIGAAAVAYIEAEVLIDVLLFRALGISADMSKNLTSRINGVDGKIELAKIAVRELGASDELLELLAGTLGDGGFGIAKKFRDSVIHARVLDAPAGLALSPGKRGKTNEVLLTVAALNGLYDRLTLLRLELIEACQIAARLWLDRKMKETANSVRPLAPLAAEFADHMQSKTGPEIQAVIAQYRQHQNHRLSLPPLPAFPEESPLPSGTEAGPPPPQTIRNH